jgi:tetratricopeptide (TPR) repeat protein
VQKSKAVASLSLFLCALCIGGAILVRGAPSSGAAERLAQARNLGKAFYENPTTSAEAVTEFRRALTLAPDSIREKLNYALALLRSGKSDEAVGLLKAVQKLDPALPHTWFNLGVFYRKGGEEDSAIEQFRHFLAIVPGEPIGHYQMGALLKQKGDAAGAIAEFQRMEALNPQLAGGHFQLYNLYRQAGRTSDAAAELATFQELKKQQEKAVIPEDLDWCAYAEIYDPPSATAAANPPPPAWDDQKLPGSVDPKTAGLTAIDFDGAGQMDLLAWSARGIVLYRHAATPASATGLEQLRDVIQIAPGDFDNDGLIDLCILTADGPALFRNAGGKFVPFNAPLPRARFEQAVWLDYDHDSDLDLVLLGDSPALIRNEGTAGFADRTSDFPFINGHPVSARKLRVVPDSKSFDLAVSYADGKATLYRDLLGGHYKVEPFTAAALPEAHEIDFPAPARPAKARVEADGSVHLLRARTSPSRHWIRVQLAGIRSLKLAEDAQVEIKAGALYLKQSYSGVPLVFDIGANTAVDVVRITWPNGLIQNETRQLADRNHRYEESQRLSGSCPMIWTWNGKEFQFIADVLGVAPLGASSGDGSWFPVNHVEYLSIPGAALQPVDGAFDLRVTEELSEVSYLDQLELYAIDHPAGSSIFTNVRFQSPPYDELRLYEVKQRIYPRAARDNHGRDVLPLLLKSDGKAPDDFARTSLGLSEMHSIELDFAGAAPSGHAALLLHGWVDWADGSAFRAASQESSKGIVAPYVEMQDAAGEWKVVKSDMGLPSGKPRTFAVDLNFPSTSRKLRIVTNMCVYWDEIFLSENTAPPQVRRQPLQAQTADLHFRGFSETRIDPTRKQPDIYLYSRVSPFSFWNPTPGLYTRYGNVSGLLRGVDDRFVIMGSGDELNAGFTASGVSPGPAGWTRDYLLKVDGWAKDSDPNTAYSTSVEPLPFHAMTTYPYPAGERYPDDQAHRDYRRTYNTRPALRIIRPLN